MMDMHEWLAGASRWLWPQMANHLWQTTIFALLALAVAVLIRKGPARARYIVWLIASAKFALPSVLLVSLLKAIGIELPSLLGASEAYDGLPVIVQFAEPVNQFDEVIAGSATSSISHNEIYCALTIIWIVGAVCFFALWMRRRFHFARAVKEGAIAESGREVDALKRVLSWLAMKKDVQLVISPAVVEPGVWGITKSVLVLPEEIAAQLSDAELEAVIMHEIVHIERRDNLTSTLQMILCCIFWFHPLVWIIDRRMLDDRERACDERVVELGGASGVYASSLLKVLRFCLGLKTAGVSSAAGSNLRRRIEQIMNDNFVSKTAISHRVLIGALAVMLVMASAAVGVISRDNVFARQTEAKRKGVSGGVEGGVPGGVQGGVQGGVAGRVEGGVQGGVEGGVTGGVEGGVQGGVEGGVVAGLISDDDEIVYLSGSNQMFRLNKQQASELNKELEEAPFIAIRSNEHPDSPLRIIDAKLKVAKVTKLYTGEGVEWFPKTDQYAVRPYITVVNNTNRRITGVVVELKAENISRSITYYNIPAGLEPGASYETEANHRRAMSLHKEPESLVAKVVGARFDDGEIWGIYPPPPPPPPARTRVLEAAPKPGGPPPPIIRKAGGVIQSEAIKRVTPRYPDEAKEERAAGTVIVEIVIDEEGDVINARAVGGPDKLKESAVEAARQWKFKPAMLNGEPVKVIGTLSFVFQP